MPAPEPRPTDMTSAAAPLPEARRAALARVHDVVLESCPQAEP